MTAVLPSAVPPAVASRSFARTAASVPAARRFVREQLLAAGQERWVDEALLVVSELATNAVLHAHSAFEVTVRVAPAGVHVQVWDDDPVLPARRVSGASSTTGRGLELAEAVATASGARTVGAAKVVWFCLGTTRPDDAVLLPRPRQDRGDADLRPGRAPGRPVCLLQLPVPLWRAAREHHDTLVRELSLREVAACRSLPARLVDADRARGVVLRALRQAVPADRVDLALQVEPGQAPWFEALRDLLDHAERLAASGRLLAPPGPAPVVQVRRWACAQVLGQLSGGAPSPWTGPVRLAGS